MSSPIIQLTDKEKILLHLYDYINQTTPYTVEISQEGVAEATGISLPHVPRTVKSLIQDGLINELKEHIQGVERRRNVYTLTAEGAFKVVELRERLNEENVVVDGKEIKIKELNKYLGKEYKLLSIIRNIKNDGVFDYHSIEKKNVFVDFLDRAPRFRTFFGREKEKETIVGWLNTSTPSIGVVYGVAGIGKTSLTLQCLSPFKDKKHIFWHNCREYDSLESILEELSNFLAQTGNAKIREFMLRKKLNLKKVVETLIDDLAEAVLVFDDFHRSQQASLLLTAVCDHLPKADDGIKILLTTRSLPSFYDRSHVFLIKLITEIELKGLPKEICRQWLSSEGMELSEAVFDNIYSLIQGHPLSMELLLHRREDLAEYPTSVRKYMYEEIFSKLTDKELQVLQILSVASVPLPHDVFNTNANILEELMRKSLLTEIKGKYEIHEALKSFVLERIPRDLQKEYKERLEQFGVLGGGGDDDS